MSAGLIKHLKKKTEEDSNTKILMSQWEFDEKLVGKSLENVGSYYPHFSSHNESHSQQILVNIERLLGSNIDKLTATDTWLILEAAYWHDIGMLFNADEVQKVFEEDDFKEYVESLANDNTQDLHEFAKVWHEDGWNKALVNHSDPHTGVEKYRQMIAEWYRRGHAKNSNSVVLDPFEKLGISSPRTELLPKRIYRYLGQICWAHGLGFDDYVMKTLPFRQTGMGTENCHPRFVACLLRLGDLFDIDDNRFCPVMARQVGNMPSFSETHKHKHQAIREFQLDNETVSITAICSTEMAYIECRNWFDWIREEIQNQMSQWKNIVPSRDFGLLPTINKLDVEMTDQKILLNDKPMKFSLDEKKVIELLQGNNLYHGMGDVVRELLQNAIDATFIRVWIDAKQDPEKIRILKYGNPYDNRVIKILEDYSINLNIELVRNTEDFNSIWKLSIVDSGTGISSEDLSYMQYMGGSNKNARKTKTVKEMPTWMKPSGTFGIGLHSAFLLNKDLPSEYQHLKYITKSINSHEILEVKLNSPLSKDDGFCFIKKLGDSSFKRYGTTTELFFITNTLLSSIIKPKKSSLEPLPQEIELAHVVNNLFIREHPKIILDRKIMNKIDDDLHNYDPQYAFQLNNGVAWFEFENYNLAIKVHIADTICEIENNKYLGSSFCFRGQEIHPDRHSHTFFELGQAIALYFDIYGESKDFVSINRNEWRYSSVRKVISDIKNIFKYNTINSNKYSKLIHGFDYNKKLGFNTIRSLINNEVDFGKNIEEMMFNETYSIPDTLNIPVFLVGSSRKTCRILDSIKNMLNIVDLDIFSDFNTVYFKQSLDFYSKNNYSIYEIIDKNANGGFGYYNKDALLFISSTHQFGGNLQEEFELNNFRFHKIPILKNKETVYESPYSNSFGSTNFVDEILNLDTNLRYADFMLINDSYEDYYIFNDFHQLITKVKVDTSIYDFDNDDTERGIIFPFFIEEDSIRIYDINKLTKYIFERNNDQSIPIEILKEQYERLIELIQTLTSNHDSWIKFFDSYDPDII
jgi:hypothetical protein